MKICASLLVSGIQQVVDLKRPSALSESSADDEIARHVHRILTQSSASYEGVASVINVVSACSKPKKDLAPPIVF